MVQFEWIPIFEKHTNMFAQSEEIRFILRFWFFLTIIK